MRRDFYFATLKTDKKKNTIIYVFNRTQVKSKISLSKGIIGHKI